MHPVRELQNQNFIEVFVNKRNLNELSQDEALSRYKKNSYILGRIFSYSGEVEENEDFQTVGDESRRREILESLNEEKIEGFKKELEDLELKHQKRRDLYQKRNKRYKELLNEGKHLKNENQFNEYKAKLIEEGFYASDHPFFCEDSAFYLCTDDDVPVKAVKKGSFKEFSNEGFIYYPLSGV